MCGRSLRGNREISWLTTGKGAVWSASGRHGAGADDARPREVGPCHRSGEPRERRRATGGGGGEPRAGAKGNTSQTDTRRTPSRASVPLGLERVRTAARLNKEGRFTALLDHVDTALLRQAYLWLKR